MKYAMLIYSDEALKDPDGSPEQAVWYQKYVEFGEYITKREVNLGGEALFGVDMATTVRVRDDERTVTDGPFAETKEQLGGFYLIEADDLDDALSIAARIPEAQRGSIEVRPVMDFG